MVKSRALMSRAPRSVKRKAPVITSPPAIKTCLGKTCGHQFLDRAFTSPQLCVVYEQIGEYLIQNIFFYRNIYDNITNWKRAIWHHNMCWFSLKKVMVKQHLGASHKVWPLLQRTPLGISTPTQSKLCGLMVWNNYSAPTVIMGVILDLNNALITRGWLAKNSINGLSRGLDHLSAALAQSPDNRFLSPININRSGQHASNNKRAIIKPSTSLFPGPHKTIVLNSFHRFFYLVNNRVLGGLHQLNVRCATCNRQSVGLTHLFCR